MLLLLFLMRKRAIMHSQTINKNIKTHSNACAFGKCHLRCTLQALHNSARQEGISHLVLSPEMNSPSVSLFVFYFLVSGDNKTKILRIAVTLFCRMQRPAGNAFCGNIDQILCLSLASHRFSLPS